MKYKYYTILFFKNIIKERKKKVTHTRARTTDPLSTSLAN